MLMHVPVAAIRPSLITRVETGIVRSARPTPATAGSMRAAGTFCPCRTSMLSSHCLINWLRWRCRTSLKSTAFCFAPAPRLCFRSPLIPNISAPRLVSSASCIPGISNYCIILISIALFQPVACLPIIAVGFQLRTTSFYRLRSSAVCSGASLWPACGGCMPSTSSAFTEN